MFRIEEGRNPAILVSLNRFVHEWHVKAYPDIFRDGEDICLESYFKSSLEKPNFHHFIAYDDSKAVGFVQVEIRNFPGNSFRHPQKLIFLHIIVVLPEYRGKGVGQLLMDEVYGLASKNNISRIELDHWAGNDSAASFFGKMGFKPYRYFLFLERK
ncbi:MAG: GNAT family N-acetyltransferase [Firmicutes bacterium]|nr:GNAT family N-acetyltransferase [Bacillota bacterium]